VGWGDFANRTHLGGWGLVTVPVILCIFVRRAGDQMQDLQNKAILWEPRVNDRI